MTKTYTEVLEAIQKANEELMVVDFGCKYSVGRDSYVKVYTKSFPRMDSYCGECREGTLAGAAFRDYRCGYCKKSQQHPNTAIPKYCNPCAFKHEVCRFCKRKVKILGKEPQLNHLIQAVKNKNSGHVNFEIIETFRTTFLDKLFSLYNLSLPFSQQDESLYTFLHKILCT